MIKLTVRGVIYDKDTDTILVQKLRGVPGKTWFLPGGAVEDGENLPAALRRELREECGVDAEVGRLLCVNQYYDGTYNVVAFLFHIQNTNAFHSINLSKTTHGEREIAEMTFVDRHATTIAPDWVSSVDISSICSRDMPVVFYDELQ